MTHGGKRPGAGRPALAEGDALVPVTARLSSADKALLDRLGVRLRLSQADTIRRALHVLCDRLGEPEVAESELRG